MNKNTLKIIATIAGVVIASIIVIKFVIPDLYQDTNDSILEESVLGCYSANLAQDEYLLSITSKIGDNVEGTLEFNNFEKDSSKGTFKGTFIDDILIAEYTFTSEGTVSTMQVAFKKTDQGFIRGYAETGSDGVHFVSFDAITYDANVVYKHKDSCGSESDQNNTLGNAMNKLSTDSKPTVDITSIQSIQWIWQDSVVEKSKKITPKQQGKFTLNLGSDNKLTGTTDCNGYFSMYTVGSDGFINLGNIAATKMYCENSQESEYLQQLSQVKRYGTDDLGNLVLYFANESGSMNFKK